MTRIGIVADDLTGATTVGALIAREGIEATVLFEHKTVSEKADGKDEVLVISTDSRPMAPEVAFERVRRTTAQLLELGATQFSKRIDTTCRGNIGPEVEGMLSVLPDDYVAVVVTAMPQSKRTMVGGYSLIDSVLLSDTDVARDVRTPVHESHIPTLLKAQFSLPIAHIHINDVVASGDTLRNRLAVQHATGNRVFVIDAVSLDNVDKIAATLVDLEWKLVCVDPGPLTVRYSINAGSLSTKSHMERILHEAPGDNESGTVLVVAGSATSVTNSQMVELHRTPGTTAFTLDVLSLISDIETFGEERDRVIAEINQAMFARPPRVVLLAFDTVLSGERTAQRDLESSSGLRGQQIATLLTQRFGEVARSALDAIGLARCAGVYLTGGDVMVNSCIAFGAHGLTLVDYVIPQVDQARLVGGPFHDIPVVCKGGLTGDQITAKLAVNRLFDERRISYVH